LATACEPGAASPYGRQPLRGGFRIHPVAARGPAERDARRYIAFRRFLRAFAAQKSFPGQQRINGHHQVSSGLRFLNVPMRPDGTHILRNSVRLVHSENQNTAIFGQLGDLRRGLQSAHRGHGHVENYNIRLQPLDRFNGLPSVGRFTANFPFRRARNNTLRTPWRITS
jgi:hypothetical protein